jgi:hypothetical protein
MRVDTDPVGSIFELGPDPTGGQRTVAIQLVGDEFLCVRVGNDEHAVPADERHSVGERESIGDLLYAAGGRDSNDGSSAPVHVGVAGAIHHELVGRPLAEDAQVSDQGERPVRFQRQQAPTRSVDDPLPAVRPPVDAERKRVRIRRLCLASVRPS